ncbi:phage tail spike protein [Streptococcus parasuis]|uniref:phage tail spike protein n=1 Tax=Streptococcus parasuis TaxID=1501662 RepID=UPI0028A0A8B3|nr:phage tail spike protein [Streptococcus parasuis]
MIYLFDKDEKLIKIVRKSAVKTALQKYALTTERYVSDRLTVELKGLNADELEQVEYMAIQTMEDAHTFHYFYVAQKFSDELTTLIGVQSGIEELRKSPVYDKRPQNAFAKEVIDDLLAGTNWQARFVGEATPHSTNFYYTSVFDALKKVCEVWDLEMQFFVEMNGNRIGGRYIDFKQRIGEAVGKRVVYGHNALQILQEVERTNIFTALVGRGKGEETGDGYGRKITFENVVWSTTQGKPVDKPSGQKYLELPLMTMEYGIKNADGSMRPKIGFVDFSEEENPEVLIERTYRALVDAARPQLTLKTSSVYLKGVKVGDTIRVVRHDKKLDYDTRIFEITFNRLNNQSSDIKLGDQIGESNEAKAQTIADKAVEQFINNEFSNFVQNLPDYLPTADGFNNNWYGTEDPTVKYPGKVLINDIWYKADPEHEGHKIMLRWTGEAWEEILRTYDSEALRDKITEEIAQVNQSMQAQSEEHDRQVADILLKTQSVEGLANQAKTDAANAMARANQVKTEAIADATAQVATVSQALSTAKTDLQNQVNAVDAKAVKVQSDADALRTDLDLQAQTLLSQAQAQTALTNRVTTVETTANGTKTTVSELSKTVAQNGKDITSVTARTKVVEDDLTSTKTTLSQVKTTADSTSQKTATLETGLNGLTAKFENLQIGTVNLLHNSKGPFKPNANKVDNWQRFEDTYVYLENGKQYVLSGETNGNFTSIHDSLKESDNVVLWLVNPNTSFYKIMSDGKTGTTGTIFTWNSASGTYQLRVNTYRTVSTKSAWNIQIEEGNLRSTYSQNEADLEQKVAEYKQTADQNYASLQTTVKALDGTVTANKTTAEQTAQGFSTRIESLETYKDGESTRAQSYFEASKTETAKQLTAERTAISANYVAKSTYDENVRGTTLKLNEVKTTADTAKQNLATYQDTVDRKLTELTSSTQTLDGKINTASAKVDTVAGQIRTEISETVAKIPTSIGGRNYILKSQAELVSAGGWVNKTFNLSNDLLSNLSKIKTVTISCDVEGSNVANFNNRKRYGLSCTVEINGIVNYWEVWQREDTAKKRISQTFTVPDGEKVTAFYELGMYVQAGGDIKVSNPKLEFGSVPTDHTLAPEDFTDEISSVKTTITQTASGVEQLSTSLSTTNNKVTTAETKISQLISDVSSKVSQTDYNTLTGRVSSAETAITQNATEISKRLTSTQVESAITGKGYITSSALQPYALSTTVQTLVKETADSFSRTISETRALIPTEVWGVNLFVVNGISERLEVTSDGGHFVSNVLDFNKTYTVSTNIPLNSYGSADAFAIVDGETPGTSTNGISIGRNRTLKTSSTSNAVYIAFRNKSVFDKIQSGEYRVKIERGTVFTDWAPAPEDTATVTALHAVNDTVDSHTRTIGAVGTSGSILDNVSKVTQTANGIVQEVSGANGLKTQVSQLAGSYAIQNLTSSGTVLNQLNLNKDGSVRIDGKLVQITGTTYIEDGVIASAKIGSLDAGKITTGTLNAARIAVNSIDGSKLVFDQAFFNNFTANEAYLKQIFAKNAFITSVQSTNMSADKITTGTLNAANVNIINMNANNITTGTLNANLISGGVLKSTNGATNFDLNNGNLLFNNNYGYIRRTANDKIFEITTLLTEKSNYSSEVLSSKFMVRKSDFSRQSGVSFDLYTTIDGKPTATTQIYSDSFTIKSSDYTTLFSLGSKNSYLGTFNLQNWGDIPVAVMTGGLDVKDIAIGGHTESLLKVVERLCTKTGLIWV